MTSEQVREMVKHYGKDTTLELLRQRINELEAQAVVLTKNQVLR